MTSIDPIQRSMVQHTTPATCPSECVCASPQSRAHLHSVFCPSSHAFASCPGTRTHAETRSIEDYLRHNAWTQQTNGAVSATTQDQVALMHIHRGKCPFHHSHRQRAIAALPQCHEEHRVRHCDVLHEWLRRPLRAISHTRQKPETTSQQQLVHSRCAHMSHLLHCGASHSPSSLATYKSLRCHRLFRLPHHRPPSPATMAPSLYYSFRETNSALHPSPQYVLSSSLTTLPRPESATHDAKMDNLLSHLRTCLASRSPPSKRTNANHEFDIYIYDGSDSIRVFIELSIYLCQYIFIVRGSVCVCVCVYV